MKSRLVLIAIGVLFLMVFGVVFWVGAGGNTPAITTPVVVSAAPAAKSLPASAAPAAPVAAAVTTVQPITSEAVRAQTEAQRKAVMPAFLKAADEGAARLQADIDKAKASGAPAAEIAAKEAQLSKMNMLRQQVLARNSDIRN